MEELNAMIQWPLRTWSLVRVLSTGESKEVTKRTDRVLSCAQLKAGVNTISALIPLKRWIFCDLEEESSYYSKRTVRKARSPSDAKGNWPEARLSSFALLTCHLNCILSVPLWPSLCCCCMNSSPFSDDDWLKVNLIHARGFLLDANPKCCNPNSTIIYWWKELLWNKN